MQNGLKGALGVDFILLLLMDLHNLLLYSQPFVIQMFPDGLMHFPSQLRMLPIIIIVVLLHLLLLASWTAGSGWRLVCPVGVQIVGARRVPEVWSRLPRLLRALLQGVVLLVHLGYAFAVGLEEEVAILHVNYIIYYYYERR